MALAEDGETRLIAILSSLAVQDVEGGFSRAVSATIFTSSCSRTHMDTESQRAIAVGAVFVVPFLIFGGFPYIRDQLTIGFIGLYWFPAIVLR